MTAVEEREARRRREENEASIAIGEGAARVFPASATCRGSYALGSACGNCPRCTDDFLDLSQKGWVQDGPGKMVPAGAVTPIPPPAPDADPAPIAWQVGDWHDLANGGRGLVYLAISGHMALLSVAGPTDTGRLLLEYDPGGRAYHGNGPRIGHYDVVRKPAAPPAPPAARICRDCRHVQPATTRDDWACTRPTAVDIVTGEAMPINAACLLERRGESIHDGEACGPAGKFWEPKP